MTRLIAHPPLRLTADHEGRIVRKRDNHARRFRVGIVEDAHVVLEEERTGRLFTLTDLRTYELEPEGDA